MTDENDFTPEEQQAIDAYAAEDAVKKPVPSEESEAGEPATQPPKAEQKPAGTPAAAEENEAEANEPPPVKPPKGFVNQGALHQERQERQRAEQRINELNMQLGQYEVLRQQLEQHRLAQQQQAFEQQRKNAEESYQNDPVAFLKAQNEAMAQEMNALRHQQMQFVEQQQQSFQNASYMRNLTNQVMQYENQFRQSTPDYDQAFQFMQNRRMSEYDVLGITDPQAKSQAMYQEVVGLTTQALQQGQNPADVIYRLAQTWGYAPATAQAAAQAAATNDAQATIERVASGQKMSTTLNGGGGKPGSDVSLADIETMDDAQFDAFWKKLEKAGR